MWTGYGKKSSTEKPAPATKLKEAHNKMPAGPRRGGKRTGGGARTFLLTGRWAGGLLPRDGLLATGVLGGWTASAAVFLFFARPMAILLARPDETSTPPSSDATEKT